MRLLHILLFVLACCVSKAQILIDSYQLSTSEAKPIMHFVVLGQSQAGGYNSSPALTTSTVSNVSTLTDGPLEVNTSSGVLIPLQEGDTFSQTGGPAPTTNIETIATSMAQQIKSWLGDNYQYVVTVHAEGGATIQELMEGGSTGEYEDALAAVSRVKALATAAGVDYNCHLVFFHGGDGGTTYEQAVQDLYDDFLADVKPTYTDQAEVYMFTHQQRPIGSPDYGIAQYNASKIQPNIIVSGPEYKTTYQGDGIHLTNHGERYMGMIFARAIWKKLSSDFDPLELDIDNATFDGTDKIIIPVLNAVGALGQTTNAGIQVYSNTTSAVIPSTTTINGSNIEITLTTVPIGEHDLEIRTAIAANGELHDSSSGVDIPGFNAIGGSPYNLDKYMVRALYDLTVFFPVNYVLNFGGSAADPAVPGTYSIWDNTVSTSDESYPISGNVSIDAINTVSAYWGFTNQAAKGGNQTVTGTNLYNNNILAHYWFTEDKPASVRLNGLNPNRAYDIRLVGLRSGTATNRETIYTIDGNSITKTSNRSGTSSIYTTDAENAVFESIIPNGSGQITITVEDNSTQFGYLNAIILEENASILPIDNIEVVYSTVQRTNENISITATPDGTVTDWYWELIDANTKAVLATSTDQNPVFTAQTNPGLYDIRLLARSNLDVYARYWEDAFYNHLPKPTEGECDEVWDVSAGGFNGVYSDVSRPGYTIGIKGSGTASFYANNLYSDDPNNPVRFVKLDASKSVITKASGSHHLFTEQKFYNVVFDGYLPDGSRGIRWVVPVATSNAQQVMIRGAYTGIHLTGMEFDHQRDGLLESGVNLGACISFGPWDFSTNTAAGPLINSSTHVAENLVLFDLLIEQARQEGLYINYNNDFPNGSGYVPLKSRGLVVARNEIYNTGRDAIQIGASMYGRVHDNHCESWGLNKAASHENGISWNAGNGGNRVFNNYFRHGKMGFNTQSGLTPWDVEAGETSPVDDYFYNNVFIEGTVPSGGASEPYFTFFQTANNSGGGDFGWKFFNNVFVTSKEFGGMSWNTNSFDINRNVFVNNIICKVGSGADHDLFDYSGSSDPINPIINNLVRTTGSESDLLFTDLANGDVSISSLSSPAYSGSPTDIVPLFDNLKLYFNDVSGLPLLSPGSNFHFGAYSGFDARTISPSSVELTFTTSLSASTVQTNEFTLQCQPNTPGWLYVVVTPGADSDPSTAQILAGLNAAGTSPERAFIMYNGQDGVMDSEVVDGLTSATAYDVHAVFVDIYGQTHTITKINDVTTSGDATAPTLSNFWISSLNRNRLYFDTDEECVATTVTGFSFASGKTATSITIVDANHGYFTMNSAYVIASTESVSYAGGSDFEDVNGNALASFGSTAATNNITSSAEQDVTAFQIQNATFIGNDFTANGTNPAGMRTVQGIPAGSNGYIEWQRETSASGQNIQAGLMNGALTYTYAHSQIMLNIRFETNGNTGTFNGTTFRHNLGGLNVSTNYFRIRVNGSNGDLISEYSTNGSTWTTLWTQSGVALGLNMYGAVQTSSTTAGTTIYNVRMQADNGLIVDNE